MNKNKFSYAPSEIENPEDGNTDIPEQDTFQQCDNNIAPTDEMAQASWLNVKKVLKLDQSLVDRHLTD